MIDNDSLGRGEVTEWAISFGDGDLEEAAHEQHANARITHIRNLIADPEETDWKAEDYEPMRVVNRLAITLHTPWNERDGV